LSLFRTQSSLFLKRLKEAVSDKVCQQAAHTIKDSALEIGAWRTGPSSR
jgi:porphobilinogen deaminase